MGICAGKIAVSNNVEDRRQQGGGNRGGGLPIGGKGRLIPCWWWSWWRGTTAWTGPCWRSGLETSPSVRTRPQAANVPSPAFTSVMLAPPRRTPGAEMFQQSGNHYQS